MLLLNIPLIITVLSLFLEKKISIMKSFAFKKFVPFFNFYKKK